MASEARKAPAPVSRLVEAAEAAEYCRAKAAQCRRLARMINDPAGVKALHEIIAEFEAQAAAMEAEEGINEQSTVA